MKYKYTLVMIMAYFVFRLLWQAFTILPYIPPDEKYHVDVSVLYSRQIGFPNNESVGDNGYSGFIVGLPYLYHFLMGKLLWLRPHIVDTVIYLRLINIVLACATVVFAWRLFQKVIKDSRLQLFSLAVLTNIPMFSFMGSAVSYDNLVNLLAVGATLLLINYFNSRSVNKLLWIYTLLFIASLVKVTALPLLGVFTVILVTDLVRGGFRCVVGEIKVKKVRGVLLPVFTFCIILVANLLLYGKNLYLYGYFEPACLQVQSVERCDRTVFGYDNYLNYGEKDTNTTWYGYVAHWFYQMINNTMHQGGHRNIWLSRFELFPFMVLFWVGIFLAFYQLLRLKGKWWYLYVIVVLFVSINLFVIYKSFASDRILNQNIEGRYLFPVIVPLVTLLALGVSAIKQKTVSSVAVVVVVVLMVWGDFYHLWNNMDWRWTNAWYQRYEKEGLGRYGYLEVNTHDGTPFGWGTTKQ